MFIDDERRERKAAHALRIREFIALCAKHGTASSWRDDVNTSDELTVAQLAGEHAVYAYRDVVSDDDTVSIGALASFAASFDGATVALSGAEAQRRQDERARLNWPGAKPGAKPSVEDTTREQLARMGLTTNERTILKRLGIDPDYAVGSADEARAVTDSKRR